MQIKIEEVTGEVKQNRDGQSYLNVKAQSKYLNLAFPDSPFPIKVGDMVEIGEIKESKYRGRDGKEKISRWATLAEKQPEKQEEANNGKISFWSYVDAMKMAHRIALELEPDDQGEHICERSRARAALVNTMMIALKDGKIDLPPEPEDEEPTPPEKESPF